MLYDMKIFALKIKIYFDTAGICKSLRDTLCHFNRLYLVKWDIVCFESEPAEAADYDINYVIDIHNS